MGGVFPFIAAAASWVTLSSARASADSIRECRDRKTDALDPERKRRTAHQEFSEPKLVKWPSFDGREISGFLYLPPKKFAGKRPVIVNIHGGRKRSSVPALLVATTTCSMNWASRFCFRNVRVPRVTERHS